MARRTVSVQPEPAEWWPDCVELGVWTAIPAPPPASLRLKLKEVDKKASRAIKDRGVMTFHAVGCSGCHADQRPTAEVAAAMATQVDHPHRFGGNPGAAPASFLYHLGDVVYKHDKDTAAEPADPDGPGAPHDFAQLYDAQFYAPFAPYAPPIFAIAGNHDGKDRHPDGPPRKSAIRHFLKNFCAAPDGEAPADRPSGRTPVPQPYPYWLLETPLAYLVGLYANVSNAGQLDDPNADARPQYDWLVRTLREVRAADDGKAVLLAVHYPPYSAAANFAERGDPNLGPSRPPGKTLEPIGAALQRAFRDGGLHPDVVLSAHAHHYQRLTYTAAGGRQVPYLIAGGGGHAPVEDLLRPCLKRAPTPSPAARPGVVFPEGLSLPAGDRVELAAYNGKDFGFLRLTIDGRKHTLKGEYFTAFTLSAYPPPPPALADAFTLDLRTHALR